MLGHGSPHNALMRRLCRIEPLELRPIWIVAVALCALLVCATNTQAREADLQLRITWGGGQQRQAWHGSARLSRGRILGARRLGLESDLPGAMEVQADSVEFWEQTPTSFDGLDIHLLADSADDLIIELTAQTQRPTTIVLPLESFLSDAKFLHNKVFDDHQNRLLVRRVSGDELRVEFKHPSLVFSPGERVELQVVPKHLAMSAGTPVRCVAKLLNRQERELWKSSHDRQIDANGNTLPIPLSFELPSEEGAYTVQVEVHHQRRFGAAFIPAKPIFERPVQLVVVADHRDISTVASPDVTWNEIAKIDLTDPGWLEQWNWLPQIPWRNDGRPISNAPLREVQHQGDRYFELGAKSWYAIPVPVSQLETPHQIEVEFPNDYAQTVGLTLMETNAAGIAAPPFLDSGFDVPTFPPAEAYQPRRHRLTFWPRSDEPWLLITNRRDSPSIIRGLRVLSGPTRLPAAPVGETVGNPRLLSVYYDKPLFSQNFTASEALEASTNPARSLNDWDTFYKGGKRLVEYIQHVGYNSAIISVLRDGSSLYPSTLLQSTPRYDNGTFFVTGQDPVPKDSLELLFRQFDKAGLKLIPALHFSSPLPELERQIRMGPRAAEGIELKNARGESYVGLYGTRRGLAPYYNPLDERVQGAIKRVIQELVARYGHHRSFHGVCIQIAPETFVQLPDEEWGQDPRTWTRFRQEGETKTSADAQADDPDKRQAWLRWRSAVIARSHQEWGAAVANRRPDAKLYIAMADSLAGPPVQREMKPRLLAQANFPDAMLRLGIDAKHYRSDGVVLLRPRRLSPILSLSKQAADFEINRSRSVDDFFGQAAAHGALNYHVPLNLRLSEFDAASPFGPTSTTTWISAHISEAGDFARAGFTDSLAASDIHTVVDGGWMIPLGQEEAIRDLLTTYRSLPAQAFEAVETSDPSLIASAVQVRSMTVAGRTYCYVLNNGPWSVDVTVDLEARSDFQGQNLGRAGSPQLQQQGGARRWQIGLRPYDLQAAVFVGPGIRARDWHMRFQAGVKESLAKLLQDVSTRKTQLSNPEPLPVLLNPSFEQVTEGNKIPGWRYAQLPEVKATVEPDGNDTTAGRQALRLQLADPKTSGWIRSEEFRIRGTGRIAVRAWVRAADTEQQPTLRIVVAVLTPGRQPREFHSEYVSHRLTKNWEELLFNPADLPVDEETDIAIGFDVAGSGEVWIDDVQVFDLLFDDKERGVLDRTFAPADYMLRLGKFAECQQYLNGYWPRYLLELVPPPEGQRVAVRPGSPANAPSAVPEGTQEQRPTWGRLVPQLPTFRLPFRNDEDE